MAAKYKYLFADLLTNQVFLEMPLYGVTFGRVLGKAASGTFSFNLDRAGLSNYDMLEGTIPGKTVMYIDRDGALIWGGIIWTRTYQEQAKAMSCTTQSLESFFYKQFIEATLTWTTEDQRNILCELIADMQAKPSADLGVVMPAGYPFADDITRSTTFNDFQVWSYGQAIDYMIGYDQGFDYTIEVGYDSNGNPSKLLRVDNVLGAPLATTGLVFHYPGNIKNYWCPESAAKGAVSTIGVGAGEGAAKIRVKVTQTDLLAAGYPDLQVQYENSDVALVDTLTSQTVQAGFLNRVPISVPTFEIIPDIDPIFGSWSLGDYARVELESPRFPNGFSTNARIVGYDASPPTSEGPESVKLIIAGDQDA